MPELDAFQVAAVESKASRLAIAAPAGSGKTRVLIERVVWLTTRSNDVASHRDTAGRTLVLTFARKAAQEVRHRLQERGRTDVMVKTFHAWALELVRRSHVVAGRLVLEQEKQTLLWKIGCRMFLTARHRARVAQVCATNNWSQPFLVRQLIMIQTALTQRGVGLMNPDFLVCATQDELAALVKTLMQTYQSVLQQNGASDFALLIQSALGSTMLHTPNYRHVFVDEVQDAAASELDLIRKYCAHAESQTWVGDSNQSLYGWRGAAGRIPEAHTKLSLRYNYRSTANVIGVVNSFLQRHVPAAEPITPHRALATPPEIICYPRYEEDRLCLRLIGELVQKGFAQKDIVILARAHVPLEQLKKTQARYPHVRAATVHAFKGLEARAVIIVNVAQNRFGFPAHAKGDTHPLLQRLAQYDRQREECNIFYVAMTRARDRLIMCSPQGEPSPFADAFSKQIARRVTLASNNF